MSFFSCGFREGLKIVWIGRFIFMLKISFIKINSLNSENTVETNLNVLRDEIFICMVWEFRGFSDFEKPIFGK